MLELHRPQAMTDPRIDVGKHPRCLCEAEVADAFEVPLAFLMDVQNHSVHSREWKGVTRRSAPHRAAV